MTPHPFTRRPVPPEKTNAEDAFPEQYHAEILFDKSVRFRLIEEYGLDCYRETEDGLVLSLDYANPDYIISWLLGFGDQAELLEPPELRGVLAGIAGRMLGKYRPAPHPP